MNNNLQNTAALEAKCKGVFSSNGYLNVGKDAAFVDPSKEERDSYKGKQFLSNGPKTGKTLDTYFGIDDSKKHLYNAEGLPYVDRVRFAETQPEKPGKGFLTSDYNKRGEFSDTIRTEQYRSQLKQEARRSKLGQTAEQPPPMMLPLEQQSEPESFLYDRVYDLSRPGPEAQKLSRETGNPTLLSKLRNMGGYNTTYLLNHTAPSLEQLARPEHARVAIVRDTFYDKDMHSHAGHPLF